MFSIFHIGLLVAAVLVTQNGTVHQELTESDPPREKGDWLIRRSKIPAGVYRDRTEQTVMLDNGIVRRTFFEHDGMSTIGIRLRASEKEFVRAIRPEAEVSIDGKTYAIGGLDGQPAGNFLLSEWLQSLVVKPDAFRMSHYDWHAIRDVEPYRPRKEWLSVSPVWPPKGIQLNILYEHPKLPGVAVTVHYRNFDGLPLFSKWISVHNGTSSAITLNRFKSEILACVEASSEVGDELVPATPNIHVETELSMVLTNGPDPRWRPVKWLEDRTYTSQVNYNLTGRSLLEVAPPLGPERRLLPGERFSSFKTYELFYDSSDEIRKSLSLSRYYRTVAPWVQENPLIFHVRSADPKALREGIDQAAAVGFELVIMTFGSGFDIENDSPAYIGQIKEIADYAHSKGVAIGGYSLLASRSIDAANDVINPVTQKPGGFATFGNSPCVGSNWGKEYIKKLYAFFEKTGCDVLEHDGSYPGDACASTTHPGHRGYGDSQYNQWQTVAEFYRWCRAKGIYLNVPDWYFLNGASKTGMGYRETNWSLPRDLQEIIERQNIFDGVRTKLPSMGWMFVPLTEYHGGGPAATIEPLRDHLDHYERRLMNLLGAGVQACFRGPRLFDSPETQAMVRKWVTFYKNHRQVLEGDLIGLRRADGRDWDGWIHVNPFGRERGLAFLYNPLKRAIKRTIRLPLYYCGLTDSASIRVGESRAQKRKLAKDDSLELAIEIPAQSCQWVIVTP